MMVANQLERDALKEAGASDEKAEAILGKVREAGELALKGRLNPAHARRIIGEIMEAAGEGNLSESTCEEWMKEWLKEKVATTKPTTVAFYKSVINHFIAFLGSRAGSHLETISASDIRRFRDSIVAEGRTGKTANHKLKCLRSIFGDAVKASLILQNPATSVKQVTESDSTTRVPFTAEEVGRLLAAAPSQEWRGVILLGAFAGLRLADASNLTSGNIDLARSVIHLMPKKTDRKKRTIEVPLHAELLAFFERNPPSPFATAPLFPSLAKIESGGRKGLSAQFREIMNNSNISRNITREVSKGAPRESAEKSFHSLRHTFTSALAKANVPEEVRMKMTGHSESETHQKYTHQELSTLRAGVDLIPSLKGVS
ncbi:tyrosine-type recombinase/integrase [Luteolibacter sp. AS25]|uniref:tyrosine-type recombinase/integrase n=1 Tax=Luteolibacter sp. AS25 TaxID=3135776 RepID=UPI00398AD4BE